MQPTDIQTVTTEKTAGNPALWLREVPTELTNVIPESIWVSLTVDQKKEILRQHNILDKYVGNVQPQLEQVQNVVVTESVKPDLIVEQEQRVQRNPEFEKALEEFREANKEKKEEEKPVLSQEDIARINSERAASASTQNQTYNFFGYQPTQTIFTNAKQTSQTGDVSDAKTWASTLIAKIFSLFQ